MSTIAAVVLTFNEEKNIGDCLESVKWTDEIVLVDSFSTDRTIEIAGRYVAKVFQKKWAGFAKDKDFGIEKASSEWIILLDSDERVTEELRREIERTIDQDTSCAGYFIPRKNYFSDKWIKHCGWYPNYMLRLFKRDKGRHDDREVHERVIVDDKLGYLKEPLIHYSYESVSDYRKRFDRYTSLEAQEMVKNNARIVWLFPFRRLFEFFSQYVSDKTRKDKMGAYLLAKEVFKNKIVVVWFFPFKPLVRFVWMYIFKLGFLDGYYGFLVSLFSSVYGIRKWIKFWGFRKESKTAQ